MTTTRPVEDWSGTYRSYDLLKEIAVAVVIVTTLTLALAGLFGAPQRQAVTFQEWATQDPIDFLATTLDELTSTSATAQYGPPYTANPSGAQSLLGVSPQRLVGPRIPIDSANDLVLQPLGRMAPDGSQLQAALQQYRAASSGRRAAWTDAYRAALDSSTSAQDLSTLAPADAGPVPVMLQAMLSLARSGAVDAALIDTVPDHPGFFVLDYTRSQLYLADGGYLAGLGETAGLGSDQWGMAATLGNWPGQVWLLPVALWYQFPPASTSNSGDLIAFAIAGILLAALVFLPYIPGLRSIPKRLGIYRLIWRRHYASSRPTSDRSPRIPETVAR